MMLLDVDIVGAPRAYSPRISEMLIAQRTIFYLKLLVIDHFLTGKIMFLHGDVIFFTMGKCHPKFSHVLIAEVSSFSKFGKLVGDFGPIENFF